MRPAVMSGRLCRDTRDEPVQRRRDRAEFNGEVVVEPVGSPGLAAMSETWSGAMKSSRVGASIVSGE